MQELSFPCVRNQEGRKPKWLSKDLVKLRRRKEIHRQWRQGRVAWEGYRDAVWMCRGGIRKGKAWMILSLEKDAKNNKKGFYRYIAQKRKAKKNLPPLINEKRELITVDTEKAEKAQQLPCLTLHCQSGFPHLSFP